MQARQSQGTDWTTVRRPATVEARGPAAACRSAEARRRGPRSGGGAWDPRSDFLTWVKKRSELIFHQFPPHRKVKMVRHFFTNSYQLGEEGTVTSFSPFDGR